MKSKNVETIFSTICFALLNILFLLSYYSLSGLIATAVTTLFYVLRINFVCYKNDDKNRNGSTGWLGVYLGAFLINALFIVLFKYRVFDNIPKPSINFDDTSAFFIIVGLIVMLIVFKNLSEVNEFSFKFFLKYILLSISSILLSIILIKWSALYALILFNISVVGVALIIDCINMKSSYFYYSSGFIYARFFLLLFNILLFLYPKYGLHIVKMFINPHFYLYAPWYMYAIACSIILVCAVCVQLQQISRNSKSVEIRVYLYMLSCAILMYITHTYSTAYNSIFVLIHILIGIVYLLFPHKDSIKTFFSNDCSVITLSFTALLIASLLLPVFCYHGVLLQYAIVCVTIFGIYAFYTFYEKTDKDTPVHSWLFWQFIITMAAIFAGVVSYTRYNFSGNHITITFVYIITTLAFTIINCENKLLPKNHIRMRIIIAVAAILFICLGVDGSKVKVNISVDNAISSKEEVNPEQVKETGKINITVDSKNAENVKAYCYWLNDESKTFQLTIGTEKPNAIDFKNDQLRIVIKDENGIVSTKSRWFFDKSHHKVVEVYSNPNLKEAT